VSEFVDACRREWRRLGVPEPAANEMAADLAADLKEAEQDGVTAEEVLGSGAFDPRAFAASWASERALVPTRRRDRMREHRLLLTLAGLVVLLAAAGVTAALLVNSSRSHRSSPVDGTTSPRPTRTVLAMPNLIGLGENEAKSAAQAAGLQVRITTRARTGTATGTVLSQTPTAGATVDPGSTLLIVVARPPAHAKHR
jgi:hypothetical protein